MLHHRKHIGREPGLHQFARQTLGRLVQRLVGQFERALMDTESETRLEV